MLTHDNTWDALLRKWRQFTVKLPCLCSGCLWVKWNPVRIIDRGGGKRGGALGGKWDDDVGARGTQMLANVKEEGQLPQTPTLSFLLKPLWSSPGANQKAPEKASGGGKNPRLWFVFFVSALSLNLDYMLHLYVLGGIPKNTFWDHFWSPVTFLGYRVSKLQNQVLNPSTVACKSSSSGYASKDSADGWIESIWKN